MAQGKNTQSILKMSKKLPVPGKRQQATLAKTDFSPIRRMPTFRSLPPSLLKLPTMSRSDLPSNPLLDLDINDKGLDEWLSRLDKVTKAAEEERNTTADIAKSVSRVSFAPSENKRSTSAASFFDQQGEPPKKRKRFARRNSFIVRDLSQLSRIAEQVMDSKHEM